MRSTGDKEEADTWQTWAETIQVGKENEKFSNTCLSAPNGCKLSDRLNKRCKVLIKPIIAVKPQLRLSWFVCGLDKNFQT